MRRRTFWSHFQAVAAAIPSLRLRSYYARDQVFHSTAHRWNVELTIAT